MAFNLAAPVFASPEDFLMALLRPLQDEMPNLAVETIIEDSMSAPYLMARSDTGGWQNDNVGTADTRFYRRFNAEIQTWTAGPDGDQHGSELQELVRLHIFTCWQNQLVVPGMGHIARFRTFSPAHRVPDWATSTGMNQYANLAKGLYRYEAKYGLAVRPDFANPIDANDLAFRIASA